MPSTTRADRDQDGVPDHADDYPTDDRRAFQSSYVSGSPTLHTAGQKYMNSGWPLGPKFRRKIGSRHTSVVKISVRQYQPGEFSAVALTNSPQASDDIVHYEVSTASDTSIDCLVFERSAYDAYESGNRDVSVVSRYSRTDVTSVSVTEQLGRGEYIFVVDYTELLTSPETDSVEVRYTVDIAEPVTSRTTR